MPGMTVRNFCGGFVQTNGWLASNGDRHVLFDAPDDAAEWLASEGIRLEALVLTHQHFDHVMHAARIREEHGCPIHAWSAASRGLWLSDLFSGLAGWSLEVPAYEVDEELAGREKLSVAGMEFQLFHVPGHSPDSVWFYHVPSKQCIVGDTVFAESIGRADLPGGSMEQLVEGIRTRLLTLPDDVTLFPGHGPTTTVGHERRANPYL